MMIRPHSRLLRRVLRACAWLGGHAAAALLAACTVPPQAIDDAAAATGAHGAASAEETAAAALTLMPGAGEQFGAAVPVQVRGYAGAVMEPFLTRDGAYLFFNDSNDPSADTNLHWARRVDDTHFEYAGPVPGVNTPALEGTPSIDRDGVLYFVSPRSYGQTLATIHRARWQGDVAEIGLVPGVSERVPGIVQFDVEISADGHEMIVSEGEFRRGDAVPHSADLVLAYQRGDAFVRDARSAAVFARINTPALEYAAALSADGLELFFTRAQGPARGRTRLGTAADAGADALQAMLPRILRARRATRDAAFGTPEPVPAADGYVEGPALGADGRKLYFHRRTSHGFVLYAAQRTTPPAAARPPAAAEDGHDAEAARDRRAALLASGPLRVPAQAAASTEGPASSRGR